MVYISNSAENTQKIASEIVDKFFSKNGGIIALTGDLGSGKTTFTQGFAKKLKIKDKIISPTFVLTRQHQIPKGGMLFHLDLYRLEDKFDVENLGFSDMLQDQKNIILIEWAEKIKNSLPKETIFLNFEKTSESDRKITLTQKS